VASVVGSAIVGSAVGSGEVVLGAGAQPVIDTAIARASAARTLAMMTDAPPGHNACSRRTLHATMPAVSGAHVVVVGGGTMGLAAAWALAARGAAVTVLERFTPIHDVGSHGGHTRIIRQAYHEGSQYVPLVREAEAAWLDLSRRVGESLLVRTGLLELGPPGDPEMSAMFDVCDRCGVDYERLDAHALRTRWPLVVPDDFIGCLSPSGGYLRVAPSLRALETEARGSGAIVRPSARVVAIERGGTRGPAAVLEDGERIVGDRLVVTAGAWLPELLPDLLPAPLVRLRRLLAWTSPAEPHRAALAAMPVWGAFLEQGFFYGFPYGDEGTRGFKLSVHTSSTLPFLDTPIDPDTVDRDADPRTLALLDDFLAMHLPIARGPWVQTKVCLYTITPSWDFLVDRLPEDPRVVIAGGFSGHGFKFAPAIGRVLADLALGHDDTPEAFSLARHGGA
jgi:monomeric sarcosine oxidase